MRISVPALAVPADAPAWAKAFASVINSIAGTIVASLLRVSTSEIVEADSPTVADAPFRIPHKLGVKPTFVSGVASSAALVYWNDDDRAEWSESSVSVRCETASTHVVVRIEA
jgi:hypothetical protein